jgi:hypothetical protein
MSQASCCLWAATRVGGTSVAYRLRLSVRDTIGNLDRPTPTQTNRWIDPQLSLCFWYERTLYKATFNRS